ncbi:MAG: ATP-grasp domain-containing protein [Bdellovibrionota bacterium]
MSKAILVFGGGSDEKLVSVASAQNVSKRFPFDKLWFLSANGSVTEVTIDELGAHKRPFEVEFKPSTQAFAKSMQEALPKINGATLFLALHGDEGEDGTLQRLFESNGVAFTGSGSASSAACFDKVEAKKKVSSAGVAIAQQIIFSRTDDLRKVVGDFLSRHASIAVKPVTSGSSFGLHMITKPEALPAACDAIAKSPHGKYMAEKMLIGRELTVGVIDTEQGLIALPPSEVVMNAEQAFDYEGKYLGRGSKEITPADLNNDELKAAQALAMTSHKALGCYGYSRTDMILTAQGPVFLETNTLPGLTGASFIPQQLEAAAIEVPKFIERQLSLARSRK